MKEDLVVEVGMKLDKSLIYYHDMLINKGLILDYSCLKMRFSKLKHNELSFYSARCFIFGTFKTGKW